MSDISRMDRAIFRICISFQYSAAKELAEYLNDSAGSPKLNDPQLHALERIPNKLLQNGYVRRGGPYICGSASGCLAQQVRARHELRNTSRSSEARSLTRAGTPPSCAGVRYRLRVHCGECVAAIGSTRHGEFELD